MDIMSVVVAGQMFLPHPFCGFFYSTNLLKIIYNSYIDDSVQNFNFFSYKKLEKVGLMLIFTFFSIITLIKARKFLNFLPLL